MAAMTRQEVEELMKPLAQAIEAVRVGNTDFAKQNNEIVEKIK